MTFDQMIKFLFSCVAAVAIILFCLTIFFNNMSQEVIVRSCPGNGHCSTYTVEFQNFPRVHADSMSAHAKEILQILTKDAK